MFIISRKFSPSLKIKIKNEIKVDPKCLRSLFVVAFKTGMINSEFNNLLFKKNIGCHKCLYLKFECHINIILNIQNSFLANITRTIFKNNKCTHTCIETKKCILLFNVLDSWNNEPSNCWAVSLSAVLSAVVFNPSPLPLSWSSKKMKIT